MGTYLWLNNYLLRRHRYSALIAVLFPLLVISILFPWVNRSLDQGSVPVAWVDQDGSIYAKTIQQRLQEESRLQWFLMEEEQAIKAVQRKKVEGAFIIQEGFEERIKESKIKETITWIRSDQSIFDTFAKEQVAAEVMRIALNSKAANTLQQWDTSVEWSTAFQYADHFWEPAPLFQMSYQSVTRDKSKIKNGALSLGDKGLIAFVFLYSWVVFIVFLQNIYNDRASFRFLRIQLYTSKSHYYVGQFISYFFAASFVLVISLNSIILLSKWTLPTFLFWNGWVLGIFFTTTLFTYIFVFIIKNKSLAIALLVGIALMSFTFGSLSLTELDESWKTVAKYFPHTWVVNGIAFE